MKKHSGKKYLLIGGIVIGVVGILVFTLIALGFAAVKFLPVSRTDVISETTTEVAEILTDTPTATLETATETVTEEVTETPTVTPTATPTPTEVVIDRNGAWLDAVILVAEPSVDTAIVRILEDDIQVYTEKVSDQDAFRQVQSEGINYVNTVGSYNEITFNPAGPVLNDGSLNPFAVPEIREAMNMLVDRDYIVQEIMGGMAVPKFLPIIYGYPSYEIFNDVVTALEDRYAYDPILASEIITTEMQALGASKVNGFWTYGGNQVELIFLIRVEDERLQIGDYIANQLEDYAGFQVLRDYRTSSEASPLWLLSDPADGAWHLYTGGWISINITRDDSDLFQFFYSPNSVYSFTPLWEAYQVTPRFEQIADNLANYNYTSVGTWEDAFNEALYLSIENSNRVWLIDNLAFSPFGEDVVLSSDHVAGIMGTPLWARNLRYANQVGGGMTVASADLLVEPWNPLAGSGWEYDQLPQNAIGDFGVINDPQTGLALPQRIESAEVTVLSGLPVRVTHDWVRLDFASEIRVPDNAWSDWDASRQIFITAGDRASSEGLAYLTANVRSVVTYPDDLFESITWHDGSPLTPADFVMGMILSFDPGSPSSPIYDEYQVDGIDSFKAFFKGFRITSTDPLIIEYYTDAWVMDAENNVATLWPRYAHGEGAWHMMALGILAEADGDLAFSFDKAEDNSVDWLDYIQGPSLEILREKLNSALSSSYIPYEPTLGDYLTPDEAVERYQNLQDWYAEHNHYWVGTGPFYLDMVLPGEKSIVLMRYPDYPDDADKWEMFTIP